MRILQVNKFHYLRGGSERYYFDLSEALVRAGHDVVPFSMRHERNRPSPYESSFVGEVDFHETRGAGERLRLAGRFVHSAEAQEKIAALIERVKPDVAHLHNVAHQLTPSILAPLHAAGVPVVQTLHDYKLVCSSYLLFANGETCERCRGGRHFQAVLQRCHHGSFAKSLLGFAEMSWHAVKRSYDAVALFLCPSLFLREKCVEFGVTEGRLVHLPYFLPTEGYEPATAPGSYALFAGRLSREKGIATLLEAARRLGDHRLIVLGEGPLSHELAAKASADHSPVEFRGYVEPEELRTLVRGAAFVIVPSEWYENLPYAVLEAFALGKPVLGARIGGIPELVHEGETGALFDPGDAAGLAAAWRSLLASKEHLATMGRRARHLIESELAAPQHVRRVVELYRSVMA